MVDYLSMFLLVENSDYDMSKSYLVYVRSSKINCTLQDVRVGSIMIFVAESCWKFPSIQKIRKSKRRS